MAQARLHPASFLGSVYNSGMELARLKDSIQSAYARSLEENGWQNIAYQYESTKARLVNKVKLLLPLIPMSADQVAMTVVSESRGRSARLFSCRRRQRTCANCCRVWRSWGSLWSTGS